MCLVLLDRPRDALQLLGDQDPDLVRSMQVANGDPIRVFALLELGDLDDARDLVCRLAVGGLARRYAYEANDCVVMLAGLALAEGDFQDIGNEMGFDPVVFATPPARTGSIEVSEDDGFESVDLTELGEVPCPEGSEAVGPRSPGATGTTTHPRDPLM